MSHEFVARNGLRVVNNAISTGAQTSPDVVAGGLALKHSTNGKVVALTYAGFAHGMTDIALTDNYAVIQKEHTTNAGLSLVGLTTNAKAVGITGYSTTTYTGVLATSQGTVTLSGYKKSGTGGAALADTENVFAVRNASTSLAILKGGGDFYLRAGGLKISNTTTEVSGMVRWSGSDFEGYTGLSWTSLTSGGGAVAGSDTQVQFNDGGSAFGADANFVWDKTNERLGIGCADPSNTLELSKDGSNISVITSSFSDTSWTTGTYYTFRGRGTRASKAAVQSGDYLGRFGVAGYYDTTGVYGSAFIGGYASENWSSSARGTYLTFQVTADGATTISEALRITAAGRVGIGTTDPSYPLEVSSASSTVAAVRAISDTATAKPGFRMIHQRTSGSPATQSGDHLGFFAFSGHNGSTVRDAWNFYAAATGAFSGQTTSSVLRFTRLSDTNLDIVQIYSDGRFVTAGGIEIKSYLGTPVAGSVQWASGHFQGHDGSNWIDLDAETDPGGANTNVQFNNSGVFGGDASLVWDNSNKRLGIGVAAPTARLEILDSVNAARAQLTTVSNTATSKSMVRLIHQRSNAAPETLANDHLGGMIIAGHDGTSVRDSWHFYSIATANYSPTITKSNLYFTAWHDTAWVTPLQLKSIGTAHFAQGAEFNEWTGTPVEGVIDWNGTNFRGHNGITWVNLDTQGGSGTPGGTNDGQIQYRTGSGTTFGAEEQLRWDAATNRMGINVPNAEAVAWPLDCRGSIRSMYDTSGDNLQIYNSGSGVNDVIMRLLASSGNDTGIELIFDANGKKWTMQHSGNAGSGRLDIASKFGSANDVLMTFMPNGDREGRVGIDQIAPQEKLHVNGAVILGEHENSTLQTGTIEWNGTNFRGRTASAWVNLDNAAGATSPGGAANQVQFNDGGSFGGDANFVWDKTNDRLAIGQTAATSSLDVAGDIEIGTANWHYLGDPSTDGSWRWGLNGGSDLNFQKRESGSWVSKHVMS